MKVALLTLTPTHNYGGILQAVALYYYLKSMGHDVTLVNKKLYMPLWKRVIFKALEVIPFQNIKNIRADSRKAKQFKPFIDTHLPSRSGVVITPQDLERLVKTERFDAVIVGSDQVWRYQYIKDGFHTLYFLDFNLNFPVKKVSYAASFGKDEWELPEEVGRISKLLEKFDAVSTREKSGVDLCKNTFGFHGAQHVLDPTFLVGAEFYTRFLEGFRKESSSNRTLVTYVLDKSKEKQQVILSIKNNLEARESSYKRVDLLEERGKKYRSVEEWLWEIKNADFVITDSFHGMVFSILFKKQFLVIGNPQRGMARFSSLLDLLGLQSRLLSSSDMASARVTELIDYDIVDMKCFQPIIKSKKFLSQVLT